MAWRDEDETLLPCPFCGGKGRSVPYGLGVAIQCQNCSAYVSSPMGREKAVSLWNKRTSAK